MDRRLSFNQIYLLKESARRFESAGLELFLVGGTVRDILLDLHPEDLDLAVVGNPDTVDKWILTEGIFGEILSRSQFYTYRFLKDGIKIDLALSRKEIYDYPGVLPTIEPATIDEDLPRRDFLINAMAISLNSETFGDLIDPLGGRLDLKNQMIRVLHPNSFMEDPTRIFRAVRYSVRLGFSIEDDTFDQIREGLKYINEVSGDRIREELDKVFQENDVLVMLKVLQDCGVFQLIHHSFGLGNMIFDNIDETHLVIQKSKNQLFFLAILVFSCTEDDIKKLINRLNMGKIWSRVVRDVYSVKKVFDYLRTSNIKSSRIYNLLHGLDRTSIEACRLLIDDTIIKQHLDLYLTKLTHEKPLLKGQDLISLGIREGSMMGEILKEILYARLDGKVSSEEDERNFVRIRIL